MNYEELLAARSDGKLNKTPLPIGEYYRQQVDGKYRGRVAIRPALHDSIVFTEALKRECAANRRLQHPHLLHFEPVGEGGETALLDVESGVFLSFEQLLSESPALMADSAFIDQTMQALVDVTTYLHTQGICHICYSPRTVLVRKGDNAVMLLTHGSFYMALSDLQDFYGDDAAYVAPEVLAHGTVDERCDVYSIGQFMKSLFERAETPMAYRQIIKKATSEMPEDRYATPQDMLKALRSRSSTYRSLIAIAAALVIALFCLALYFDMMPEATHVEFVKPAPRQATDDLLEHGLTPEELGEVSTDSLSEEDLQAQRDYQAKAEAIFRKNYEKEAERILSRIYNTDYMSNSEKQFRAQSQSVLKDLMDKQQQMGEEASLTPERSQLIASEIIDRITERLKKQWGGTNSRAVQK